MYDHHVDEHVSRLRFRLTSRRTRRWALGSLLAAVAAGTTQAGVEAHKPGDDKQSHGDDTFSIPDMFEMQMMMNLLSQLPA